VTAQPACLFNCLNPIGLADPSNCDDVTNDCACLSAPAGAAEAITDCISTVCKSDISQYGDIATSLYNGYCLSIYGSASLSSAASAESVSNAIASASANATTSGTATQTTAASGKSTASSTSKSQACSSVSSGLTAIIMAFIGYLLVVAV